MPQRNSPVLDPVRDFIDQILTDDQKSPRKQRHTAHRIYVRLCAEFSNHPIAEHTVREYVQFWKLASGKARREIFISHWQFDASFCTPGKGHEKGGVEGEAGFFRRNHLVSAPQASSLAALNESLLEGCRKDFSRIIGEHEKTAGEMFKLEQPYLLPLQGEDFELAEEYFRKVNDKGCVDDRVAATQTSMWLSSPESSS
jgi:hypothetical protein